MIANKDDKKTALHVAATHGHVGVMEEIISQCPDCWEMVNGKDQNILHVAVENRKRRVINFILKNASLNKLMNLKDADGNTPLHHLVDARLFATNLIQHPRADKTVFNKKNWNPLDVTVYSKIMSITKSSIKEKMEEVGASLAGFTVSCGYNGNGGREQGMAILTKVAAFKVFVVTSTLALVYSISAVLLHFLLAISRDNDITGKQVFSAFLLCFHVMVSMLLAFVTGSYAVLLH
ncbi:hypothetical protein CsSME_00008235 [Camellia sinensis var. sinensis]